MKKIEQSSPQVSEVVDTKITRKLETTVGILLIPKSQFRVLIYFHLHWKPNKHKSILRFLRLWASSGTFRYCTWAKWARGYHCLMWRTGTRHHPNDDRSSVPPYVGVTFLAIQDKKRQPPNNRFTQIHHNIHLLEATTDAIVQITNAIQQLSLQLQLDLFE